MEASGRHLDWPTYYQVSNAKKRVLYPDNIIYGDARVEVGLKELIRHSTARILKFLYEENFPEVINLTETEKMSLELCAKFGGDGQGDHSEYMQRNIQPVSGASIYCISYVPLQLKAQGRLVWENSEPNSPLICMPLMFPVAAETDEFIQCEEKKLQQQIKTLPDILFSVGQDNYVLKAANMKIFSTMWDGKSLTSIAKSYLGEERKLFLQYMSRLPCSAQQHEHCRGVGQACPDTNAGLRLHSPPSLDTVYGVLVQHGLQVAQQL
jgi:hypothetical protein